MKAQDLRFAVLATDVALFTIRDGELLVRMIPVERPPHFVNSRGLPGGLIKPKETAEEAARRLVGEKAGVAPEKAHFEQLATFSEVDRDPRGRVVAVGYIALVPWELLTTAEQADTKDAWWSTLRDAKKLAYDHDEMLDQAVERLRSRITYTTVISKLMPREFTLTELEHTYESILRAQLDKRNFRKKILKINVLAPLAHKRTEGTFRPAQLYRFASTKVQEIGLF